jgi:hypothetical protein
MPFRDILIGRKGPATIEPEAESMNGSAAADNPPIQAPQTEPELDVEICEDGDLLLTDSPSREDEIAAEQARRRNIPNIEPLPVFNPFDLSDL